MSALTALIIATTLAALAVLILDRWQQRKLKREWEALNRSPRSHAKILEDWTGGEDGDETPQ